MNAIIPAAVPNSSLTLGQQIEREATSLLSGEIGLGRGYARLAGMLVIFKLNEEWRNTGHPSFGSYILSLAERLRKSPQVLYSYILVAERLLPACGEAGLDKMGITKAQEIVKAANRAKKEIPPELIAAGMDERYGRDEIRALAHRTFELKGGGAKGRYLDIGGFYVDDEQYKTFVEAVKISKRILGIPKEMPEWQQRQRIILFWAQEISGTYAADAYGEETK